MIVLHGSAGSPFVSRVRMQAYAKGLKLELRPAALGTPEFQRMNPLGKMPVLEQDGFVLPESLVICEYLEDAFPTPSLLGDTPEARARVRLIVRTVDLYCGGVMSLLRAAADPSYKLNAATERAGLDKGLDALEIFLDGDGFAASKALSLADCTLVPWLFYATMLTKQGDDALTRRPKLARYVEFIGGQELTRAIWGEMDEAYRAFMTRWKAGQVAANNG
ncbi:glutathione S-transferase family protein [Sorangium sp. So ce1389]|uniref:glutathione S-transferase family protein n=1 Tax=Sorangium sp. So ce1389 TaxID=3133336 RepID=UPI003F647A9C